VSVFFFRWLGGIPRAALSAVIMVIAVQHFDLWSLRLMSRVRGAPRSMRISTAVDLLVVIVVAIVSIALNIVLAVFIGVAIAAMLFVFHMSRSVVRRSYRCDAGRSRKSRTAPERDFLERAGGAILVMELQGALFFGTGETLANAIDAAVGQGTNWVILDLRRLTEVDSTGAHVLVELKADLAQPNVKLWLAAAEKTVARERMEEFGTRASFGRTEIFPDIDRAIQQAEDELLRVEGHMGAAAMELDDVGLFAGFAREDLQAIKSYMTRKSYARDEVVFREGDPGDEVLVVSSGSASAYLHLPDGANIRLATFSPGTVFGELAILDRQARSATVVADQDLVCYALTTADYAALAEKQPASPFN
jgi:SulP family sulfate permease